MTDPQAVGIVVAPGFRMLAAAGPASVFAQADGRYLVSMLSESGGVVPSAEGWQVDSLQLFPTTLGQWTTLVLADLDVSAIGRDMRDLLSRHPRRIAPTPGTGASAALRLVREDCGSDVHDRVARALDLSLADGGIASPHAGLPSARSERVQRVLAHVAEHLADDLSVPHLAAIACLSERQFVRVFALETGTQPARLIRRMRAEAARTLVETTTEHLSSVARRTGLGDADALRRACLVHFDRSPQDLRRNARPRP